MANKVFPENQREDALRQEAAYQQVVYLLGRAKSIADVTGLVMYAGVYSPKLAKGTTVAETGKQMLNKVAGGITENAAFKSAFAALVGAGKTYLENAGKKK